MANRYWRDTSAPAGNWSTAGNWYTAVSGGSPSATPAGSADVAFFNHVDGLYSLVYLAGNVAIQSIRTNGNGPTSVSLVGGVSGTPQVNTITVNTDTSFVIGSATSLSLDVNAQVLLTAPTAAYCTLNTNAYLGFGGIVSGAKKLSLSHSSDSIVDLTQANTYSGGTDISGSVGNVGWTRVGTSTVGSPGAVTSGPLGTGTITLSSGKLSSTSTAARTLANALVLNGTMTLCDATSTGLLTFSGATTISGTTSLSIAANYVLMQGVFGGTGAFTLSSGELDLEGATGTKSGGTTLSGGTLYLGFGKTLPDQLGADSLTINSGSAFFCGSSNSTNTNTITGSGGFLYARPRNAVVTFSNAGAYTGTLRIFAGASDGAGTTSQGMTLSTFPTGATNFTFMNQNTGTAVTQTFRYTGTANIGSVTPLTSTISMIPTVAGSVCVWQHSPSNGTATMAIAGAVSSNASVAHTLQITNDSTGLLSFSGGIAQSGAGTTAVTKTGTGPVSVSGTGTYTGAVTVSAGTLNANSATALGAASSTAAISVTSGATLSAGAALNYSSPGRTTTISGTGVSGVDAGCLVLANAGPINLGAVNATNNTYVRGTTTTQLTSAISWSGSGGLRLGAATGTTATFSGAISVSSGTLTAILFGRSNNPDLGTVVLGTTNTFAAPAQIDFGTLRVSADNNLGTAPGVATAAYLVVGGSTTLATTATFTLNANRGIALGPASGSGTGTIDVASATTLTYGGVIANNSAGAGKLTKTEAGILKLTGANTYTGGTDINAGVVQAGNIQALGTSGTVTLGASGTLQTLTTGGQNGKLTVAALNNSAGGTIRIGG